MEDAEFFAEYSSHLRALVRPDKTSINALTMLAEAEAQRYGPGIVSTLQSHILTVRPGRAPRPPVPCCSVPCWQRVGEQAAPRPARSWFGMRAAGRSRVLCLQCSPLAILTLPACAAVPGPFEAARHVPDG